MPSFRNTPILPYHSTYFSGSFLARSPRNLSTRLVMISPSRRIKSLSCNDSREMLRGTSSQSTTPRTQRMNCGNNPRAFCWISTRRLYSERPLWSPSSCFPANPRSGLSVGAKSSDRIVSGASAEKWSLNAGVSMAPPTKR